MKYPNLQTLVPEGEHFDESAIGEGVYLSVAHIDAIEAALSPEPLNQLQQQLDAAQQQLADQNLQLQQAEASLAPAQQTIEEQNQQIAALKQQVAELGGKSSGTGSTVQTVVEVEQGGGKKTALTINDPEHPLNQAAAAHIKAKEAAKAAKPKF